MLDGATINFGSSDLATIEGKRLQFKAETGIAVFKQAPYSYNFEIRLFLPRVRIWTENNHMKIATVGFGKGWQGAPNPPLGIDVSPFQNMEVDIARARQIAEEAQSQDYVLEQMEMQAQLFKEKSDLFSPYRICPPAGDPIKLAVTAKSWPGIVALTANNNLECCVQISPGYAQKFGHIFAVPVWNVDTLPPGDWVIDGTAARHERIDDYEGADLHPTNIVNGYYVDWEIFSWDESILKEEADG
nr:hypothetical protein 1 [bacterium]